MALGRMFPPPSQLKTRKVTKKTCFPIATLAWDWFSLTIDGCQEFFFGVEYSLNPAELTFW
jgi:hypothetical protein